MDQKQNARLFVSYRQGDTDAIAKRMFQQLIESLGPGSVTIDGDGLSEDERLPNQAGRLPAETRVLLVMIGDRWSTREDSAGRSRLHHADDRVRKEVEWAQAHDIEIVPVLVDGATLPTADELPDSIRFLSRRYALKIGSDTDFSVTINRLIVHLCSAYGLKRRKNLVSRQFAILMFGLVATIVGATVSQSGVASISRLTMGHQVDGSLTGLALWELLGPFLLGLGPLAIAMSFWMRCIQDASLRPRFANGIFPTARKSPKAILAFAFGLASFGWGVLIAPASLALAWLGWSEIQTDPMRFRGRRYVVMAIILSSIGTSTSSYCQYFAWNDFRLGVEVDRAKTWVEHDQRVDGNKEE